MANLETRLQALEAAARRWNLDTRFYTSFSQDNSAVTVVSYSRKSGGRRGEPIEFKNPRAALDFILDKMAGDPQAQAQIYVSDLRLIMPPGECEAFDLFFPEVPNYTAFFDLRNVKQDVTGAAFWAWKNRTMAGVKYDDFWRAANARIDALLTQPGKKDV